MTNFFKYATRHQETYPKRFLETINQGQNVMVSLPLAYSPVSLYAFAAMLGGTGIVVAVCANMAAIRNNLVYLKNAGFTFPDVAVLDGSQMPHEERVILEQINRTQVRLLYTTADRFPNLAFLNILAHNRIQFLLIEEADRFLPSLSGYSTYQRLRKDGLSMLRKCPPLAILTAPLSTRHMEELGKRLNLKEYIPIQCPPRLDVVTIHVKRLITEHQKLMALLNILTEQPAPGKVGSLDKPGNVLIQTAYPAQAEKLAASLLDYGFETVRITHFKKSTAEQKRILELANTVSNTILINAGCDTRAWCPPSQFKSRLVFWSPPSSLDDLWLQLFRLPDWEAGSSRAAFLTTDMMTMGGPEMNSDLISEERFHRPSERTFEMLHGLILYTKEDFEARIQRLKARQDRPESDKPAKDQKEAIFALKEYRHWIELDTCRLNTLHAYIQGESELDMLPCGRCDRCRVQHQPKGFATFLRKLISPLLY